MRKTGRGFPSPAGNISPQPSHVLLGCKVTILGNITVGNSCKVGSGSIVLKSLPCGVTAVGIPAKIVGRSLCKSAGKGVDHALRNVISSHGDRFLNTWTLWADSGCLFEEVDKNCDGKIGISAVEQAVMLRYAVPPPKNVLHHLFEAADADKDGLVDKPQFESILEHLGSFNPHDSADAKVVREWEDYVRNLSQHGSAL